MGARTAYIVFFTNSRVFDVIHLVFSEIRFLEPI